MWAIVTSGKGKGKGKGIPDTQEHWLAFISDYLSWMRLGEASD